MKISQIKKKTIQLCLLSTSAIILNACGNSGSVSQVAPDFPATTKVKTKVVAISTSPIIPTQDGVNIDHKLHIDNHTDKKLILIETYLSGATQAQAVVESKSAKVNALACTVLDVDGACTIGFTPKELDGSSVVKLTFKDDEGKLYTAAQLLEYSSSIDKISPTDGFYVSNSNIQHIQSTNHYTLSIPFISDNDYESVTVSSRIITLTNNVSCANGASKGSHCTALLTFPSAPEAGYSNSVSIQGITTSGTPYFANLTSTSSYNDIAHLAITSSTQVIKAVSGQIESLKKTINIVNTGVVPAINVKGESLDPQSTLFGVNGAASYLKKEITCNSKSVANLPAVIDPAQSCEITFLLNNENATGSEDYSVSYQDGVDGGKITTTSTKIYYRGLEVPDYAYIVTAGYNNLSGTQVGESVTTTLHVINTGTKAIQQITIPTTLPTGLTIDKNASTCEAYGANGMSLESGNFCTYALRYAPPKQAVQDASNVVIDISAKSTALQPSEIIPKQSVSLYYSSVKSGNGLIIVNNSKGYLIFADGKDKRISTVLIQNTGATTFNLTAIILKAKTWSPKLTMIAPNMIDGVNNSFSALGDTASKGEKSDISDVSIANGAIAALEYKYGPTDEVESGLAIQELVGVFSGTGADSSAVFKLVNNTGYKAIKGGIQVTLDSVKLKDAPITNYSFDLFSTNPIYVIFKYTAGTEKITGFRVNDSNLPFGFTPDTTATTCPTTSKSTSADAADAGVLENGTSCSAAYFFMDPKLLNHSLFYTAATSRSDLKFNPPPYTIAADTKDGGKTTTAIHVVTPAESSVTLKPSAFANISAKGVSEKVPNNATVKKTIVTFNIVSISEVAKAKDIVVKPSLPASFWFESAANCTITSPGSDSSCSIVIASPLAVESSIPFTYSSAERPDYNAINSAVTISKI